MRWWPLFVAIAACGMQPRPRQVLFPTLERDETYYTRISNLRTTLGRAGIALRVAGHAETFATYDCESKEASMANGGCARCELAGEEPQMDGAVIEATTRAFARYPTEVLVRSKIAHVAICRKINHEKGETVEHPAGLADIHGHGLLLSLRYFLDQSVYRSGSDFTVDDIAHHEVFHLIEHELMAHFYFDDPEWNALNPIGFGYRPTHNTEPRRDGFVNPYAATAPTEDKASVFELLMAHPDDLCELAKSDEIVRTKTRIIWQRVEAAVGTDSFMRATAPCVDWVD
ncbi:MAG: putative zinc-binding metallopeptidase [Myxococcota bacterium]|nr:putative zinc-binding metallopeptidase [Myxococcota bacterium]